VLGWEAQTTFPQLVRLMVAADLKALGIDIEQVRATSEA
jgi:GDP-D-mannose dehydratase